MLSHFSHVPLFATLWTVALQAPPSMEFSGLAKPSPNGYLPEQLVTYTAFLHFLDAVLPSDLAKPSCR